MPDTITQWFFAAYFAVGSLGGIVYIATSIVDKLTEEDDDHDPWEVHEKRVVYHEPMPHMREAPISARKK